MNEDFTKDIKATDDVSGLVTETLEKATTLIKAVRLEEALEEIMAVEKKARQASDAISVTKIVKFLLNLFKEIGDFEALLEKLTFLSKRRGQLKKPIIEACNQILDWISPASSNRINFTDEMEDKIIKTMTDMTEGKLFVEVERAKFIQLQAEKLESKGQISEASNLLANVQAEAFSGMDLREKMSYIINQMRVVLLNKDFIRCQIISKKIYQKNIDLPEMKDLKVQYNRLLVQYFTHIEDYMEVAKSEFKIFRILYEKEISLEFKIPAEHAIEGDWKEALVKYVYFLLLAPFDNEQTDALNRLLINDKKALDEIPNILQIVEEFLKDDFIDFPPKCVEDFQNLEILKDVSIRENYQSIFKKRLLQHNLRVVATFYRRAELSRLAELLSVSVDDVEENISEMINSKFLYARIDRPGNSVLFGKLGTSERLDANRTSFAKALKLLDETTLLIRQEKMMHEAIQKTI